ncbi:MAG: hypothetical protein BWY72_01912 [Bacteroidetes bacterium ADurb.Bin416]|nr:MAG: hypothetical protein BWY72_01912 [Bacteroidetes bacterium ADurb.Bin416]
MSFCIQSLDYRQGLFAQLTPDCCHQCWHTVDFVDDEAGQSRVFVDHVEMGLNKQPDLVGERTVLFNRCQCHLGINPHELPFKNPGEKIEFGPEIVVDKGLIAPHLFGNHGSGSLIKAIIQKTGLRCGQNQVFHRGGSFCDRGLLIHGGVGLLR